MMDAMTLNLDFCHIFLPLVCLLLPLFKPSRLQPIKKRRLSLYIASLSISFTLRLFSLQLAYRPPFLPSSPPPLLPSLPPHVLCWTAPLSTCSSSLKACRRSSLRGMCVTGWLTAIRTQTYTYIYIQTHTHAYTRIHMQQQQRSSHFCSAS